MTANQSNMIGPNTRPMLPVPQRCIRKRSVRMTSANSVSCSSKPLLMSDAPSIADSTDTLGVSTASAAKSAIASMLRPITSARCRPFTRCSTRAPSASVPPSPSFDARITTITYLIVTTMMSAQTNIESAPSTDGSSTVRPMSGPKAAWKA